jgi:hypothetical protein
MRNVSNKIVEKIKTHILCSVTFFRNRTVYEIISKNMMEPERSQRIWRMRVACWISKAKCAKALGRALRVAANILNK